MFSEALHILVCSANESCLARRTKKIKDKWLSEQTEGWATRVITPHFPSQFGVTLTSNLTSTTTFSLPLECCSLSPFLHLHNRVRSGYLQRRINWFTPEMGFEKIDQWSQNLIYNNCQRLPDFFCHPGIKTHTHTYRDTTWNKPGQCFSNWDWQFLKEFKNLWFPFGLWTKKSKRVLGHWMTTWPPSAIPSLASAFAFPRDCCETFSAAHNTLYTLRTRQCTNDCTTNIMGQGVKAQM